MNFTKKITLNSAAIFAFLSLTGCAPVIIGGGAVVGALATRDKGVTGSVSDTQISTVLKSRIYSHSSDLYTKIGMNVQNGEVLLTGSVPTAEWQADAERIAWEVNGVKQVLNQIEVSEGGGLTDMAKDATITSQIKSLLLFDAGVRSLNYSIKTVGGVVYVMGDAQSQEELNLVSDHASKVSGVKKVMNYARVKGEPAAE
ncbi:BON domain-containing protein [Candidatus Finniella inopinata]|nr:BON domain-containing protein [Candidatus Finniella inopinata]